MTIKRLVNSTLLASAVAITLLAGRAWASNWTAWQTPTGGGVPNCRLVDALGWKCTGTGLCVDGTGQCTQACEFDPQGQVSSIRCSGDGGTSNW